MQRVQILANLRIRICSNSDTTIYDIRSIEILFFFSDKTIELFHGVPNILVFKLQIDTL